MKHQVIKDIHWLVAPTVSEGSVVIPAGDDGLQRIAYPFPPEIGQGWLEYLTLADGVKLSKATHRFRREAAGNLVLAGEIEFAFPEDSFHVATIRGGIYCRREFFPEAELVIKPGVDFFRYADRFHVRQMIDASSDSEIWSLVVSKTVLVELLGEDIAAQLLGQLGLFPPPVVKALAMPASVSTHLHATLSPGFAGNLKKLYAQSKVLEYLCALSAHVISSPSQGISHRRERIRELHGYLQKLEGKLPTLDELAKTFGMSSRILNEEFTREYGQTIYAFISECRLQEAHAALTQSDVPMKLLAARLGYTHVNNFINAFRKKFGYSPGSLRRGAKLAN